VYEVETTNRLVPPLDPPLFWLDIIFRYSRRARARRRSCTAEYNIVLMDAMMGMRRQEDIVRILRAGAYAHVWNITLTCLGLPQFSQLSLHTRRVLLKVQHNFF
jgi:hypothetical protein